jgi:hypothetical protein
MNKRRFRLLRKIPLGMAIFGLVVIPILSHSYGNRRSLSSPSCAARALLIVLNARRDITANDSLKLSDVHAQLSSLHTIELNGAETRKMNARTTPVGMRKPTRDPIGLEAARV